MSELNFMDPLQDAAMEFCKLKMLDPYQMIQPDLGGSKMLPRWLVIKKRIEDNELLGMLTSRARGEIVLDVRTDKVQTIADPDAYMEGAPTNMAPPEEAPAPPTKPSPSKPIAREPLKLNNTGRRK